MGKTGGIKEETIDGGLDPASIQLVQQPLIFWTPLEMRAHSGSLLYLSYDSYMQDNKALTASWMINWQIECIMSIRPVYMQ